MYHPGKVLQVFSRSKDIHAADASTQAMLEMWDENMITVLVEPKLNKALKKEDIVLVDYRPMKDKPVPRLTVTKVLKGKAADETWKSYKEHHKKRKATPQLAQNNLRIEHPQPQAYVG